MEIAHLTLNTGHLRMSPRSEVAEFAVKALDSLVKQGRGACPGMPDVIVQIERHAGYAIISIGNGAVEYIVCVLAWQLDEAEEAWSQLAGYTEARMPESLPWLAVLITPAAMQLPRDKIMAVADLERCVAWTILAQEGLAD